MDQYTIAPLARMLSTTGRDYVTRKELQIAGQRLKISRRGAGGNARGQAVREGYQAMFEFLLKEFSGQRKISQTGLIAAGDSFLRAQGYVFQRQIREPASTRRIYMMSPCYDWAYYAPACRSTAAAFEKNGHHQNALFYHRGELRGECLHIG